MLPDVGATELMLIAAVALIVVGPKDLPMLMRKVGQFMARMRGMANEFRASFDEMARQTELDELRREVQALREGAYLTETQAADSAGYAHVDDIYPEIQEDIPDAPEAPAALAIPETPSTPPAPKPRAPRKPKAAAESGADPSTKPRAPRKPKAKPASEAGA